MIGENNIDPNEILASGGVDTFSLTTYSYMPDSIISDNAAFGVLGSYVDPVFGKYNAEIYTQFRLSGLNPDFGNLASIQVDSFVLALQYVAHYGKAGVQTIEIHELSEDLYLDSTYYSKTVKTVNTNFGMNSGDLVRPGYADVYMDPSKLTVVGNDTLSSSQFRVQLHTSKAKKMLIDAMSGGGYFQDNDAFLNYFKGLRIRVNNPSQLSGDGGVFYFNLNDPDSKLTIYYTQNGEQKEFDFLINSSCADFNHVDVNMDGSGTAVQALLNDPSLGQTEFYTQSFGTRAVVKIPGLDNIPKNAVIHKAVLVMPVQYHNSTLYTPGYDMSVATLLEEGTTKLFSVNASATYNNYTKRFEISIRNYVQAIVNDELANTQLVFSPTLHNTSAERIIFNGSQSSNKEQPKLYILYTEF